MHQKDFSFVNCVSWKLRDDWMLEELNLTGENIVDIWNTDGWIIINQFEIDRKLRTDPVFGEWTEWWWSALLRGIRVIVLQISCNTLPGGLYIAAHLHWQRFIRRDWSFIIHTNKAFSLFVDEKKVNRMTFQKTFG